VHERKRHWLPAGGVVCGDVDEALAYVLDDPMGIFW
jgi:hypothetical protein